MRKNAILTVAVCAVVALAASHSAIAGNNGKKAGKINLCHNVDVSTETTLCRIIRRCPPGTRPVRSQTTTTWTGKVINVNRNAARAHRNHGDFRANPRASAGDTCERSRSTAPCGTCVPIQPR